MYAPFYLRQKPPFACLLGLTLLALGLTSGASLQAAEPLRVGVTPSLPPMVYKQGHDLIGLEIDLARELGRALNRPIEFVEVKWEDQIPNLSKGKTDIIMSSMSITQGRQTQVDFADAYLRVGQMALIRREDLGLYLLGFPAVLEDPVGVQKGTTGDFLVQQRWPKSKRRTYRTPEKIADAVLKKRVGMFVSDATLVWWLAGRYETQGLATVPMMLTNEELAWAIRKGNPELLNSINSFIASLRESGRLTEVLQRWLPQVK